MLKARLDVYSDEWRTAQPDPITKIKMPTNLTPTGKVRKPRLKKTNNGLAQNAQVQIESDIKPQIDGKLSKRKRSKSDKVTTEFIHQIQMISSILIFKQKKIYVFRKKIQMHQNGQQIHSSNFVKSKDRF